jgi:hypothetical protein
MYPIIEQTQFTFILDFILIFYFFFFHRLDLVSVTSTAWIVVVLVYPSLRRCLSREKALSLSVGGTRAVEINKIKTYDLDRLIFRILSRSSRLLRFV